MRNQTCCFTGHRNIPSNQLEKVKQSLHYEVTKLIAVGYVYFGCGGAIGFDTIAALEILSQKAVNQKIKLILVLPCPELAEKWSKSQRDLYEEIKSKADKIVYISYSYDSKCIFKRSRHLVNYSSVCISYFIKNHGGTKYTADYARQNNLNIVNIGSM